MSKEQIAADLAAAKAAPINQFGEKTDEIEVDVDDKGLVTKLEDEGEVKETNFDKEKKPDLKKF